jgi:hypothetical protein
MATPKQRDARRLARKPPRAYLVTWVESGNDKYYSVVAHHKITRSVGETRELYQEIIARQDVVNPAPGVSSLPCPQVFVVIGDVRYTSDGEYQQVEIDPQFVTGGR